MVIKVLRALDVKSWPNPCAALPSLGSLSPHQANDLEQPARYWRQAPAKGKGEMSDRKMLDPTPKLSDDTLMLMDQVEFPPVTSCLPQKW
jgi:hypothetical protein